MHLRLVTPLATVLVLLTGCTATIDQGGLEQRTAQAIGRPVGQFSISEHSEEAGGRINYSVQTHDGVVYSCYLYSATGFQKAMSFGQIPHSDAICTAMVDNKGNAPAPAPKTPATLCNALLRAAGRC